MSDKIFDDGVSDYLLSFGVKEKQINEIKFSKAKDGVIKRLENIIELLRKNNFEKIKEFLSFSPAGDGMGDNNFFINFGDIINSSDVDLSGICDYLEELINGDKNV